MRVGILHPQSYHNLPAGKIWSGRIRAKWLWENWPEAGPYRRGGSYDAILFTMACANICAAHPGNSARILDVCNPDWENRPAFRRALALCDAVSCSSPALAERIRTLTRKPVFHVPDRLDLSRYPFQKEHAGIAREAVWFGYASSQDALAALAPHVLERNLRLTVISDFFRPELFGALAARIDFEPYRCETFEEVLLRRADIALNPRLETGRFLYKSNNRTLTAWALGIPVAVRNEDLDAFREGPARNLEAERRRRELRDSWDIRISVQEYRALFSRILEIKR